MARLTLRDVDGRAIFTPYGLQIYCSTQATADCICKLEETLQAQEPIAPKPTTDDDWMCGNCANGLVGYTKLEVDGVNIYRLSYCPNCGRAVKW